MGFDGIIKATMSTTTRTPTSSASALPVPERLRLLRSAMQARALSALLVPTSDPHLSEYLPERWQAREWLSGFTGSAGTLLVSGDRAALFTDTRYWEQAESELAGTGIDLVKLTGAATPAYVAWLEQLDAPTDQTRVLGLDGSVMGLAQTVALQDALKAAGWRLNTEVDVMDKVWAERPGLPAAPVFEHTLPHASTSRSDKLKAVRTAMQAKGATHHWVSTLDAQPARRRCRLQPGFFGPCPDQPGRGAVVRGQWQSQPRTCCSLGRRRRSPHAVRRSHEGRTWLA